MKKAVVIILFLALITCAFSGCTEEGPVEIKSEQAAPAPRPAPMLAPMPATGAAQTDYQYVDTDTEQKIIQRASLSIEVVDFQASSNALILIVERSDGFVSDSYSYVTGTGLKRGDFTIRVPTDEFLSVISEIEQIGTVKSKHTSGQDVTEEYIDLKARIDNSERQEQRLLEILDMANNTQEVLEVEREIWRVRSEIEQLTGRINYLENRIELSTISVSLYEQEPITHSWGIRDAFRAAFEAFVSVIRGFIILVGYAVPILILVGLGWLIKSKLMPKLRKGKEGKVKE
ncbi:DUF4349 domain-containing protein [Halobacteriota archaeon]